MFQFRRFPTYDYFIHHTLTGLLQPGCPIRKSPDITPAYGSPRLIAVNHVLHRLPVPRHSPCALCNLTCYVILFVLTREFLVILNALNIYPFILLTYTTSFKTVGCICLSLVCLALLCSVFKVRFFLSFKLRIQYLSFYLNTEVYFRSFIL